MDGISAINDSWRTYATICRLCLQKDGFMLGIFNHIYGREKSICKKIIDCTALPVRQGDGLPNVICHRCLFKIEFCLEFRQLCFMSDATLRQLSGISKENGVDNNAPHLPFYEQLGEGSDENVVMVVDPNTVDYESEYESDVERQSDAETNEFEGKNVSMCKFCDYAFTDKTACENHETNAHNTQQPYNCASCSMNFADRLQYSAHMKGVHKNDKPYNCPQCDKTFARRSDLRKHTIVHTGVKPYTCSVCFKSFSRNTNLSKHMRIHSGKKPFVCPKCPRTFTSKGDLNRHIMIHTGQKPFRCNYCHLTFGRKDKLLRHEKRHWPQENAKDKSQELRIMRESLALGGDYPTPYGSAVVSDNNYEPEEEQMGRSEQENMVINLDPFHHNNYGPGATPHHENASESEVQKDDLPSVGNHLKDELPTGDQGDKAGFFGNSDGIQPKPAVVDPKPYKCAHCEKQFSSVDNLRYHESVHSGVRPFSCHLCNKSFIRKRELDRHFTTHTGAKPFKCQKCHKGFGRKDKLVRHMRIHERLDNYNAKKTQQEQGEEPEDLVEVKEEIEIKEEHT